MLGLSTEKLSYKFADKGNDKHTISVDPAYLYYGTILNEDEYNAFMYNMTHPSEPTKAVYDGAKLLERLRNKPKD